MSMPPRWKIDVVVPKHDFQTDQAEADEDGDAQRVHLGPGLHHQGQHEQDSERAGTFQEEAERLTVHRRAILTDQRNGTRDIDSSQPRGSLPLTMRSAERHLTSNGVSQLSHHDAGFDRLDESAECCEVSGGQPR
jgi:hypothetical protein